MLDKTLGYILCGHASSPSPALPVSSNPSFSQSMLFTMLFLITASSSTRKTFNIFYSPFKYCPCLLHPDDLFFPRRLLPTLEILKAPSLNPMEFSDPQNRENP